MVSTSNPNDWYLDSGAIRHITGSRDSLNTVKNQSSSKKTVTTAGREKHRIEKIKLNDVLYIFSLKCNLMLVCTLADKRNTVVFMNDKCFVLNNPDNRLIIESGSRDNINNL
uniref:Retrovirus-related Pol polyprotein from transposon TNT 1-94-like beta-barrel domain-containing protein n=2 Tax=Physcomitrium patens TaxID=3218 RepID=A0A2K1JRF4_PHYPA|nr:hypothetical protein PHYPA_016496 [Physcomitrium patens]